MKKSLKSFDPDMVARTECKAWKVYYEHRFLKLFFILTKFLRNFFGFGYWRSIQAGYYSASAAMIFRIHKGKETELIKIKVLRKLTKFYKIICDNSLEKFDYKKTAELELYWWYVDRYPSRYEVSPVKTLADTMAEMFRVAPEKLIDYANFRNAGLIIQDEVDRGEKQKADWDKVLELLQKSYRALHASVQ